MSPTIRRFLATLGAVAMLAAAGGLLLTASPAVAASHEIRILDGAFGAAELTVQVGDTVTWTNVDERPHTVTGEDGSFDSGNLNEGATFSFTFTEPGTYSYVCLYHDEMRATIVVQPASSAATVPAAPASTPQPAAGSAAPASATHPAHAAGTGSQPDTALPAPADIPAAAVLLWGLGLLGLAVGVAPMWKRTAVAAARPRGGWRR